AEEPRSHPAADDRADQIEADSTGRSAYQSAERSLGNIFHRERRQSDARAHQRSVDCPSQQSCEDQSYDRARNQRAIWTEADAACLENPVEHVISEVSGD